MVETCVGLEMRGKACISACVRRRPTLELRFRVVTSAVSLAKAGRASLW